MCVEYLLTYLASRQPFVCAVTEIELTCNPKVVTGEIMWSLFVAEESQIFATAAQPRNVQRYLDCEPNSLQGSVES